MRFSIYLATAFFLPFAASPSGAAQAVPAPAQTVIQQVHRAAKAKNFSALEKLMAKEFLWSFGGDGNAKQAIEAWKANPRALRQLYRITGSRCVVRRDESVECPPIAGVSYRARFIESANGWLMVSFVEGD